MTQTRNSQKTQYRHMNERSLQELIEKMNHRVVLHLFSDSMQPDLLFREIETCIKTSGDLNYPLIENDVYKSFNRCANVEEAEVMRDKLWDSLERMTGYLNSRNYERRLQMAQPEELEDCAASEQAIDILYDRMHDLLFSRAYLGSESEKTMSKPVEPQVESEPGWIRYEKSIQKQQTESSPQMPELPKMPTASVPAAPSGYVQISENGVMNVVTILCLALIVFGSISALSSILAMKGLTMLTSLIYGSIWALCITNLIFLFVYYAGKLLHVNIADTGSPSASLFEKYSVILWADLILFWVLVAALWAYMIKEAGSYAWIVKAIHAVPSIWMILGTLILFYLVYRSFVWLRHRTFNELDGYQSTRDQVSGISRSISSSIRRSRSKAKLRARQKRNQKLRQGRSDFPDQRNRSSSNNSQDFL